MERRKSSSGNNHDCDFQIRRGARTFPFNDSFRRLFAVWGLVAALAPTFTQIYNLSATSKSLMIAIPVLLGSLGRIPTGMLADRFGGHRVFAALLVLSALPAIGIGLSTSYAQLLMLGLFLGLAGTTFSVGVGFTSKWFAPEKQGTCSARIEKLYTWQLPIVGATRKGASMSEVQRG